jgi:hypothetical protein
MRMPERGFRIFGEWPLSTAMLDVAPTELGVFRGWCSYKGVAPTELGGLADRVAIKISFPRGLSESASLTKMQN